MTEIHHKKHNFKLVGSLEEYSQYHFVLNYAQLHVLVLANMKILAYSTLGMICTKK